MALTRQDWEQVKDKFIDTKEMLHKHLVGYDILKRMFTDEQMLQYTSNIRVESQYEYTCLATYVGGKWLQIRCKQNGNGRGLW